jgi:branched-chain amino acid transport system permease protein
MVYYLVLSLHVLGSDDGLTLDARPSFGFLDLGRDATFYYAALIVLLGALALARGLLNAPPGRALQGIRDNETRMEAIGFATYRLKLIVFVIAGAVAGLGGGLLASLNKLVAPDLLQWTQSGLLMIMVILGGAGRLLGGVLGAVVLLTAEEVMAGQTIHWPLGVGVVLLAVVLFAPEGIAGSFARLARRWRAGP